MPIAELGLDVEGLPTGAQTCKNLLVLKNKNLERIEKKKEKQAMKKLEKIKKQQELEEEKERKREEKELAKKKKEEEKERKRQEREEKKERGGREGFYMTGDFGGLRPLFQRLAYKLGFYRDRSLRKSTRFVLIGDPYYKNVPIPSPKIKMKI